MTLEGEIEVALALCQCQELLGEFPSRLQISRCMVKSPQPKQYRENLLDVSNLLTEFPCSGVGVFHFWGSKALGGNERDAKMTLENEFLQGTLSTLWKRRK
jgi:hypothetical protein